ncbi:MAG: M20/M25/M40 family metallo-hydrolase [Planctomycetota bacterium]|nr:M20/M25/M40 family metallo-hydrolase [Planctomycetota bacterium]
MRTTILTAAAGLALASFASGPCVADEIEDIINQASLAEYEDYLRVLTGVDPIPGDPPHYLTNRYSFGDDILVAAQWMHDLFESFGLAASFHEFDPAYGPNVIGELTGTTRPDDIYIYGGHYDTYNGSNQYDAPGCDDNGSGTAATLMAARILSQYEFEGTIRFIAFSGEEQWMVGSQAYAQMAYNAGENIIGAINLDMFLHPGWDNYEPDPDYDIDIGGNNDSQWLAQLIADYMAAYTPIDFEVHNDEDFVSDQWAFWQYGYDAVGLIENTPQEIWGGSNDDYHQSTDTMDNPDYDWDFGLHVIRGSLAGLVDLAGVVLCPADFDGDGDVDTADLLHLLGAWGTPEGDVDGDGDTDTADLLALLAAWGECP